MLENKSIVNYHQILKGNVPRFIIFILDVILCLFSIVLAYLLRFNFSIPTEERHSLHIIVLITLLVRSITFLIFKTYAGIVRYTSTRDASRIFLVILAGSVVLGLINVGTYYFYNESFLIPTSIIIIDFVCSTLAMTGYRLVVKILYFELYNPTKAKTSVIIYGAGDSGIITKRALDRDAGTKYKVLAFLDDDSKKIGKTIEGIPIYASSKLEELLQNNGVAHLILSIQHIESNRKQEIIETCLAHNTKVLNVPPVSRWINGELSFKQIKKINIEDLLERDVIKLDEVEIKKQIVGKVVLVTGAAGSIGSEIVRQVAQFAPERILLLDQAETPLYHIELELFEKFRDVNAEIIMGDIRNKERMEKLFNLLRPNIVFHAAAYKHVPMMENNPAESVYTNVEGTKILADLSIKYQVERFVMISTDKAVNPTSIMGASKRIAEIYIQSLNQMQQTKFITTRFGNVLGSNGSVIPLFRKQIEKGGPITITHPEITRFFMTIPEACQLVLEAGAMGKGGEIFIFDMGKSVKIVDLAKKMIKLSGLTLGKDIQIIYTGLRPGEKLYEELLNNAENTLPTHHPKIMIAKVKEYDLDTITKEINILINLVRTQNNFEIVRKMKQIVPEFLSKNSIYEKLDLESLQMEQNKEKN